MQSKKRVMGADSLLSYIISYSYLRTSAINRTLGDLKRFSQFQTTAFLIVISALPVLLVVFTVAGLLGFRVNKVGALVFFLPYAWAVGTYVEGVAERNCESVAKARQALPRERRIRIDATVSIVLLAYLAAMIALLTFSREIYLGRS